MSEPVPTRDPRIPPAPPVREPLAYRPLSGFAVAGLAVASLFALLVLVAAVVALYQGAPFFYSPWIVLLPAAALVLSLVARNQIRSSEGTRAGEALAGAGVWISLLFGLGYFVYFYVTGLAVQSQANAFLTEIGPDSGFFPHLQKAAGSRTDLYAAFLESLPATLRGGTRPEDEAGMLRKFDENKPDGSPGMLTSFRRHFLVRIILTAPPGQVQVEPLGVQAWDYEDRSYKVRRLYRVTTPEAAVEMSIPAWSNEGESAGEQRRWYVPLQYVGKPAEKQVKLTPMGEGLRTLRLNGQRFVYQWREALNEGKPYDFARDDRTVWKQLPLSDHQKGYVQGRLQDLFRSTEPHRLENLQFPFDEDIGLGEWTITPEKKVQTQHTFRLNLDPQGKEVPYMLTGTIVVETLAAVDPLSFRGPPQDIPTDIRDIVIIRAAPVTAKKGDKQAMP